MAEASVKILPGGYLFVWPTEQVQIRLARFADDGRSRSTSAELTITSTEAASAGHLHQARLNLTSTPGKRQLIKDLEKRDEGTDWATVIEATAVKALEMHRQGEPIVLVGQQPVDDSPRFRLQPLLPEGQATIIFGEGGSFKSFLALLASILILNGQDTLGLKALAGNVLYCDYETSESEINERVAALYTGLGIADVISIPYRYCYHALADDIEMLQAYCADNDVSLLIVDSVGAACGGDPNDAQTIIRMFAAIRSLRTTSLLIDHVAKRAEGDRTPYGSVYKTNLARSVWEAKRVQNLRERSIRVGLFHRKVNRGPLQPALGFSIDFDSDGDALCAVNLSRLIVGSDAELAAGLPLRERILAVLKTGALKTDELADMLGTTPGTVRVKLAALKGKVVRVGESWGLVDTEHEIRF